MPADTFALSVHASWRCRHSGACCSSGWPIPIDAERQARIDTVLRDGTRALAMVSADDATPFVVVADATPDAKDAPVVLLGVTSTGHCVFHDADAHRCGLHRALGHDALPLACRMFPRVSLSDRRGVRISLSHYCPSAAARLFDEPVDAETAPADSARTCSRDGGDPEIDADDTPGAEARLAIVRAPAAFPAHGEYDGLDARDAFPPLLRPGVLLDWETVDALEAFGVACFADAATTGVEAALERFATVCETLRGWRASDGALIEAFHRLIVTAPAESAASAASAEPFVAVAPARDDEARFNARQSWAWTSARDAEVRACVPAGVACPAAPAEPAARDAFARHVAPVWPAMARPVGRYLAARLFGAWCWYQGQGLRSLVRSLDAALAVLRVEAARQTMATGRMLDRDQMRDAFRQADLLGLHLASRDALAARWSAAEREGLRP